MTPEQKPRKRRFRQVEARPGHLIAAWGRDDVPGNRPDLQYAWGGSGAQKPDARILSTAMEEAIVFDGKTLVQVLKDRGYDVTTLRFSVQQKAATHD